MAQFSLKSLFVSVTLIAAGAALLAFSLHRPYPELQREVSLALQLIALPISGAFLGSAIGILLSRPVRYAIAGTVIVVLVVLFNALY